MYSASRTFQPHVYFIRNKRYFQKKKKKNPIAGDSFRQFLAKYNRLAPPGYR